MIFIDTEFNDKCVLLLCALDNKTGERWTFDVREGVSPHLLAWVERTKGRTLAAYAASAEITTLLRLGIDPSNWKWIDLMAECRMVTMSLSPFFIAEANLIAQLLSLEIITQEDADADLANKNAMRTLILSNTNWTYDEWCQIVTYCWDDIKHLPTLYEKLSNIHKTWETGQTPKHMWSRGEYVRVAAEMDWASPGFPVDEVALERVFGNRTAVKWTLAKNIDTFWKGVYEPDVERGVKFNWRVFNTIVGKEVENKRWKWLRTEKGTGFLSDKEYLKNQAQLYPEVESLRQAKKSIAVMNSRDMRELLRDGFIKPSTFAFAAKTGRNGLKPKQGFLLNLPNWMRRLVCAKPGWAIVSADWSQQEIAIAASLSGDEALINAYKSGDVYLALGKMTGEIPEWGTKESHKLERDKYKALQLALGYGKGVGAIADDLWAFMKHQDGMTYTGARIEASKLLAKHKTTFKTYWAWIEGVVTRAKRQGWITSKDGWVEFVTVETRRNALLNFPSQSGGADMMRRATCAFYQDLWLNCGVPLLCSQHDGFYWHIPIEAVDEFCVAAGELMDKVSNEYLGFVCRADFKVFKGHYIPERDNPELWKLVTESGTGDE